MEPPWKFPRRQQCKKATSGDRPWRGRLGVESLENRWMLNGVSLATPFNGQDNVGTGANITAVFDFDADPASVNGNTVQLRDPGGVLVPATVSYNVSNRTATLNPDTSLILTSNYYTATVNTGVVESGTGLPLDEEYSWSFTTESPVFLDTVVFDSLVEPTVVRFSPDGRIFVAEKSGLVKVFEGLNDSDGPDIFADLREQVHNYWDRGLLGMALHPDFPASPYVYLHYTYNAPLDGSPFPAWETIDGTNDEGPATTGNGPPVSSKLSRLTVG